MTPAAPSRSSSRRSTNKNQRHARPSDSADLDALAQALTHCDLVTCDAFMADVIKRARLDLRHQTELFSGRRRDVHRLRDRLGAV